MAVAPCCEVRKIIYHKCTARRAEQSVQTACAKQLNTTALLPGPRLAAGARSPDRKPIDTDSLVSTPSAAPVSRLGSFPDPFRFPHIRIATQFRAAVGVVSRLSCPHCPSTPHAVSIRKLEMCCGSVHIFAKRLASVPVRKAPFSPMRECSRLTHHICHVQWTIYANNAIIIRNSLFL